MGSRMGAGTSKRVLVTGGAGFLGSHICERLLSEGHEVLCGDNFYSSTRDNVAHLLGNPRFELMRHDVTFPLYVEVDQIFNLACPASPIRHPRSTATPRCILRRKNTGATSTRSAEDPATTKENGARRLCFSTIEDSTICRSRSWRIFNTYGPRMNPNDGRVVSNFIVQALRGHEITIYGDGAQTRSFCYVDDLIEAIIRMMETPSDVTGPINIGNPKEFTIRELAELIIEMTGTKSKIRFEPLPSDDPRQRQPNISMAKSTLKWEPKTQLREGLTKTIAYFENLLRKEGSHWPERPKFGVLAR